MVIPRPLRDEAGIAEGTLLKLAVVKGGKLLVTPQITIDRSVLTAPKGNRRGQSLRALAAVVAELRQEARKKGLDKLSSREIHAIVTAARRDLRKTAKRPTK